MPKTYQVTLPIAGVAYLAVDADSEKAAIAEAMKTVSREDIQEWEALEHVVEGNVCYAPVWDAEAEEDI